VIDLTRIEASKSDERRADQVADLADRITRGETPSPQDLETLGLDGADSVARLLPAMQLLSELADEEATEDRPPAFVRPPDVLGDFRLGREIGRGGIGVVYEATQISLGRRVAVKVLPPASLLDRRQLRRFEIEAQAAAALQHPNIVPVFAYGTECGVPFFAMRLIDGRNLAEIVGRFRAGKRGGMQPREVAELGRQAAEALDYAHRNDVLHRDIKPSNLLVDAHQRLWVADFGLARIRGDSDLTASGDVLGTLRYLSPEQAKGRRDSVDGRSDVYALGATLYELLTLRPVYAGDDRAELLIKIISDEPHFSRKLDGAVPAVLKTIVLKALAKNPAERYATAGELAADLTLFLADQPIQARPPTLISRVTKLARRHWKGVAALGLTTVLLLLGAVAAALWSNSRLRAVNEQLEREIDRADRHAREARIHALTSERHARGAQLRLAAQALDAGQLERAQRILRDVPLNSGGEMPRSFVWRYLWHRARREIVVLFGPTPRFTGMAVSPDGKLLATTDGTAGLELWDAASGDRIRDMEKVAGQLACPTFSKDGSLISADCRDTATGGADGFSVWDVTSGRRLARLSMDSGFFALSSTFLPGQVLLGSGHHKYGGPPPLTRLWSLAGDSTRPRLLGQYDQFVDRDSASVGRGFITTESPTTFTVRGILTGEPTQEFHVGPETERITAWASSSHAEIVAAVTGPEWKLHLWDGLSGKLLARHSVPENVDRMSFSPDGTKLACIDQHGDVHLIDRMTGTTHRVVSGQADRQPDTRITFSPDNTRLATVTSGLANVGGQDPVSIWEAATGRRLADFRGRSEVLGSLSFTPDSRALLISARASVRRWRLAPADNDNERQPAGHKDEAWSLAFSPDGRTVATGSDDSEPDPTIKVWDAATSQLTKAWQGGEGTVAALAFSPDGHTLASGHLVTNENVRIWDAATGRLVATLDGHVDRVRTVAFAPDGKSLATGSSDGTVRLWDVASWHVRSVLSGHRDTVHAVAFSPDGKTLASASNDGDVRLWDLRSTGGVIAPERVLHNRSCLMAVAFAPDGKALAVADDMGSITLWDLEQSTPIRLIHSDGDELRQVAFTPDGTALATAGIKGSIRLWDPATGQELACLKAHRAQINGLTFSPDGSILGSVAHDGSVRLWRAEP
jgi:eukaryotic-like serine/threonine-protein kinase